MPDEFKHGIECAEFETLLSEALDGDGQLSPARKESFEAHRRVCAICGPLFADVQAGQQWLRSLETVEPPANLVHNILAATSGVVSTRALGAGGRTTTPLGERLRERWDSFFTPLLAFVRQPRFVMSFGMIFFSFSLALNAAGVKPSDVAKVSLRPSALRHAYNDAQIKVVQYYDNIRFVYEIESKVRELKRANTPAEPAPEYQKEEQKQNHKNDTSGQPDNRQDRNYSQEYDQPILAALRDAPPAVTVTTNRRSV
ncbi:MAG: anti-sigma factor family protein [Terriglobales bacterium]